LEATAARLELGLAEARVQALRTELNPHFFFNALNAISGLVRRGENDAAVQMLARLGELLRLTLDRDLAPEIPLYRELALLDRYLDIERARFGDRLTVDIALDPPAEDACVPALILQPLVENAIRHGITKCPGPGRIQILAKQSGTELELSVRDTGDGLGVRDLTVRREGIGLSNTRARIAAMYGDAASLRLENAPGGGALVTLRIPWRAMNGAVAARA
jgi:LytS/YehU family sensor histidine kinase